jgi:outer membrane protein, heavy metal efflux system
MSLLKIPVVYRLISVYILLIICLQADAQNHTDTLNISLPQAEKIFLDSNLSILAAHYNVDAAAAQIIQAKYWDNPVLNTDQVIMANNYFLPYKTLPDGTPGAQYYFEVDQLIKTAGKRGKLIAAAQTNKEISELQLEDVIRKLTSQLHVDYYTITHHLSSYEFYQQQQLQLNTLLAAMKGQLDAGNISQKDYLQLQSLSVSLKQDMVNMSSDIQDAEADLKTLLHISGNVLIKPENAAPAQLSLPEDVSYYISQAKQNNPYYKLQQKQTVYQQQLLTYQQALRNPDVTVKADYDRQSNYAPNYVGMGVSLPLPLFNKNKGNIQSAGAALQQQQVIQNNAETELENNVANAYNKLMLVAGQDDPQQRDFLQRYDALYQNMFNSYKAKQISFLDFINFFNDYKDLQEKILQQKLNLLLAADDLNYETGIDVIK